MLASSLQDMHLLCLKNILKEKVPLPSPTPVHRYTNGGKIFEPTLKLTGLMTIVGLSDHPPSQSGVYSKYCMLFAKQPQRKCRGEGQLGKLVLTPFKDFNNAKGKKGVLEKCQYDADFYCNVTSQILG